MSSLTSKHLLVLHWSNIPTLSIPAAQCSLQLWMILKSGKLTHCNESINQYTKGNLCMPPLTETYYSDAMNACNVLY